jgi:ABC-type glycerol-3-phosphate transport system permease component
MLGAVLRHLFLVTVSVTMLIPIYWVLRTSLAPDTAQIYPPELVPWDMSLFAFTRAWYYSEYPRLFLNSAIVTSVSISLNIVFNAAAGYALTFRFPGRRLIIALLLVCMLVPYHVTIIPAFLITSGFGLVDTYAGIILPGLSHIILIFLFKASFEAVPKSLIESARIDGLRDWEILVRVLMPLSKAAVVTNIILCFIWSWNDFLWPLIVVSDRELFTLPLGLSALVGLFEDTTGPLYAYTVMVLVPGILVFLLCQREFVQGLVTGATKG